MADCFSHIADIIDGALKSLELKANFSIRYDKTRKLLSTNAALTSRVSGEAGGLGVEAPICEHNEADKPGGMSSPCNHGHAGNLCGDSAHTPMETAERIASFITASPLVSEANIAPPGFINIKLSNMGLLACLENLRRESAALIKNYRRKGLAVWNGKALPCGYYPSECGEKYIIIQAIRKSRALMRIAHQEKIARISVKNRQALDDCEQCAGRGKQTNRSGKHVPAGITSLHGVQTSENGQQIPQDFGLSAEEINILLETADLLPCLSQKKSLGRALELGQLFCHYYNNCSILKGSAKLISLRLLISEAAGAVLACAMPIEKQEAEVNKGK